MLTTCPARQSPHEPRPPAEWARAPAEPHLQQQLVLRDPLHWFDQQVRELQPVAQALL